MLTPQRLDDSGARGRAADSYVWYASFGSNMHRARLECYLSGGRPAGGARTYPGCRDARAPMRALPVMLPGVVYFATESPVWTGGCAFYDPAATPGEAPARAYLVRRSQFSDIAAQEMHRSPGEDLDLERVEALGRVVIGHGRYETLVCPGTLDGYPVLTFTSSWAYGDVPGNPPSAAYLRHLAAGLMTGHGWDAERTAAYLAGCPGAAGLWTPDAVCALITDGVGAGPR
ncbi:histone deacetylase [Streptomyces sp. TR06-5]|uniref:histone deacetylase n=1 Tax=unclassified Streptomyces TaxID=2593676 RepID=UPI00399FAAF0